MFIFNIYTLHRAQTNLQPTNIVQSCVFSTSLPTLLFSDLCDGWPFSQSEVVSSVILAFIFLMGSDDEHVFTCLLSSICLFWEVSN